MEAYESTKAKYLLPGSLLCVVTPWRKSSTEPHCCWGKRSSGSCWALPLPTASQQSCRLVFIRIKVTPVTGSVALDTCRLLSSLSRLSASRGRRWISGLNVDLTVASFRRPRRHCCCFYKLNSWKYWGKFNLTLSSPFSCHLLRFEKV